MNLLYRTNEKPSISQTLRTYPFSQKGFQPLSISPSIRIMSLFHSLRICINKLGSVRTSISITWSRLLSKWILYTERSNLTWVSFVIFLNLSNESPSQQIVIVQHLEEIIIFGTTSLNFTTSSFNNIFLQITSTRYPPEKLSYVYGHHLEPHQYVPFSQWHVPKFFKNKHEPSDLSKNQLTHCGKRWKADPKQFY